MDTSIQTIVEEFPTNFQSVVLATLQPDGAPYTSYAPFVMKNGKIYILVSTIATHYGNLLTHQEASVLMITDEATSKNIFFRKRLSYQVTIDPKNHHRELEDSFIDKFGAFAKQLFQMDFMILECQITSGTVIVGPGQAYHIDATNTVTSQMTGRSSSGHGSKN